MTDNGTLSNRSKRKFTYGWVEDGCDGTFCVPKDTYTLDEAKTIYVSTTNNLIPLDIGEGYVRFAVSAASDDDYCAEDYNAGYVLESVKHKGSIEVWTFHSGYSWYPNVPNTNEVFCLHSTGCVYCGNPISDKIFDRVCDYHDTCSGDYGMGKPSGMMVTTKADGGFLWLPLFFTEGMPWQLEGGRWC